MMVGQSDSTRIDSLISRLSWKSITTRLIWHSQTLTFEDSTVKEIIKIRPAATEKLLNALNQAEKTVITHIMLTDIWSRETSNGLDHIVTFKDCDKPIGIHYIYNGLVWETYIDSTNKNGFKSIKQSEIDNIKDYWIKRIIEKKNISISQTKKFNEILKMDSIEYPCNVKKPISPPKNYVNNSSEINLSDLLDLLNKKNNGNQFESLWKILGNDSIIHQFKDCFYVNYNEEGLSFRFGKDSILSTIFIEKQFNGKLLYSLTINDNRNEIEKKLGTPNSHYPADNWDNYPDKHLYFSFWETGVIREFSISKR